MSSIKYFAFLCFMMFFTFLACVFFTWLAHVDNATGPFYFFCVLSVLTGALVTWMIRDCYGMYKFEKTRNGANDEIICVANYFKCNC